MLYKNVFHKKSINLYDVYYPTWFPNIWETRLLTSTSGFLNHLYLGISRKKKKLKISAFPPNQKFHLSPTTKNFIYLPKFLMTFFLVIDIFHVLSGIFP